MEKTSSCPVERNDTNKNEAMVSKKTILKRKGAEKQKSAKASKSLCFDKGTVGCSQQTSTAPPIVLGASSTPVNEISNVSLTLKLIESLRYKFALLLIFISAMNRPKPKQPNQTTF